MKIIVFGATGSVGSKVVDTLLAEGHEVTAFSRHAYRLKTDHPALTRTKGDALNPADVSVAVAGQDAVVVALGAGRSTTSRIRSEGTLNVIRAMHEHGVRRLVCQSTLGARESWGNLDLFWKTVMFGFLLKRVHADHELQELMVEASGRDWTIVRPSAFTDDPETGRFETGFGPEVTGLKLKIPRADLARFLSRQVCDLTFLRRPVAIST